MNALSLSWGMVKVKVFGEGESFGGGRARQRIGERALGQNN